MPHPTPADRAEAVRFIDEWSNWQRELERVIAEDTCVTTTNEARHFLARVKAAIARPRDWAGSMGRNGDGPAIESVIRQADALANLPNHLPRQHQRARAA